MFKNIACLIVFFTFGIIFMTFKSNNNESEIKRIIEEEREEMFQKYGLSLIGSGSGEDNGINMLGLSFVIYRPVTLQEARQLIINITDSFLKKINETEKLKHFLKTVPFSPRNIEIFFISYSSENLDFTYDPLIWRTSVDQNGIKYVTRKSDTKYIIENTYQETYEEAKAILEKQGCKPG